MKSPLRKLVAERLPGFSPNAKKVDFTRLNNQVLRGSEPSAKPFRGLERLISLGIASAEAPKRIDAYLSRQVQRSGQTWALLTAEAWVAHRPELS
jgi:hypothetical protein